jgi:hypothetical protein
MSKISRPDPTFHSLQILRRRLAMLRDVEVVTGDPEFRQVEREVNIAWVPAK